MVHRIIGSSEQQYQILMFDRVATQKHIALLTSRGKTSGMSTDLYILS